MLFCNKYKNTAFYKISKNLMATKELSGNEKIVLTIILDFYFLKSDLKQRSCTASQSTLASLSGLSRKTVNRSIHNLVNLGYIITQPRFKSSLICFPSDQLISNLSQEQN